MNARYLLFPSLLLGCTVPSPPARVDAAAPPATQATSPPASPPSMQNLPQPPGLLQPGTMPTRPTLPSAVPFDRPAAAVAEVDITGKLVVPPPAQGVVHLYITDGECWQPKTRAYSETTAAAGQYFVSLTVPQSSRLWVCAAAVPKSGAVIYHAALARAPLDATAVGRLTFGDLDLTLARGPSVKPPAARPAN